MFWVNLDCFQDATTLVNYTHKSVYQLIDVAPIKLITTEKPVKFKSTTSFWEDDIWLNPDEHKHSTDDTQLPEFLTPTL